MAMTKNTFYIVVLIVVVVGVDLLFFRHHVWERLIVNIGIDCRCLGSFVFSMGGWPLAIRCMRW